VNKILSTSQAIDIAKNLKDQNKKIVLAGGCFDIIHVGHIAFLEAAKNKGDVLFVLLESDKNISRIKGEDRPINTQVDRALILACLEMVDYVIKIPDFEKNSDYDEMIISLKPDIIATTKGDPERIHKERQADKVKGEVEDVVFPVVNKSTTRLVSILRESL
jgi:rfaE bifunctional protein nucleotidyltransferase chain/domain